MDSVSLKLRIQIGYPCKNLIALEIIWKYQCLIFILDKLMFYASSL